MEPVCRNGVTVRSKMEFSNEVAIGLAIVFSRLALVKSRNEACFFQGMNFWIMFFAAQVVVSVIAAVREKKHNARFEGEKLVYRS